ncbi:hypothetical protein AMTRI_Chr01g107800 [Amborella trichopoda]
MSSNNDGRNYQWMTPQDVKLLDVMASYVKDKLRMNGVFCRENKNRLRTLKINYANIKTLIEESGFRWIEDRRMVTTDFAVCEEYWVNYLLCNMCLYVHFAWLFYHKITVWHQNTKVRASLLWMT